MLKKITPKLHKIFFKAQEEDHTKLISALRNLESAHKKQFEELSKIEERNDYDEYLSRNSNYSMTIYSKTY